MVGFDDDATEKTLTWVGGPGLFFRLWCVFPCPSLWLAETTSDLFFEEHLLLTAERASKIPNKKTTMVTVKTLLAC